MQTIEAAMGGRGQAINGTGLGRGCGAWSVWPRGPDGGIETWLYARQNPKTEKRIVERQGEDLQIQPDTVPKRLGDISTAPTSS